MDTQIAKIGVCLHGVTLNLESDHPPLIDYAAKHLHGLVEQPAPAPDLVVKCWWSEGGWDSEDNLFLSNDRLNTIGKRMLGNDEELIWLDTLRMKGLQLRFRRENGQPRFDVAYRFHPKKENVDNLPEYKYKKYFSLMSYLVYYPLMWYLDYSRGWTILHASAMAAENGAIMIGGLGGVGKTTTCVALMRLDGLALVSENIVFTDGDFIYPCYEPIRLDKGSLTMLGENLNDLTPMTFPEGLKDKWLFHLEDKKLPEKVKPATLFFPQFASQAFVKPLLPAVALEKISAMNRLTRELDDYGWYAAALDIHWPKAGQAQRRIGVLSRLVGHVRSFEIGIDRAAGVGAVVEEIMTATNSLEMSA